MQRSHTNHSQSRVPRTTNELLRRIATREEREAKLKEMGAPAELLDCEGSITSELKREYRDRNKRLLNFLGV